MVLRGRVERASALQDSLIETIVVSALMRAHPEHDAKFQTRWAAHSQLCAIITFIEDDPNLHGLIPDLHRLQEALLDITNRRRVAWLVPDKKPGQPPLKTTVSALRGRYAAVMDFLMKRGGLTEIEAAKYVVRHGAPQPLMRGSAARWKVLQDWRQQVTGNADSAPERCGFHAMWKLIDRLGFGKPGADIRAEARKLMPGLKNMAAKENPENPGI